MSESGLAGIGKFVMRNRQYLGCLRVRGSTLILEQLHFADEVDPPAGVLPARLPQVAKRELDMALQLIEGFSGTLGAGAVRGHLHEGAAEASSRRS